MSEEKAPLSNEGPPPETEAVGAENVNAAGAVEIENTETGMDTSPDSRLIDELKQAESRALRAQAELENYRKRVRREMEEAIKYAQMPVLRDLLPVLDNLVLAIEAIEPNEIDESLVKGVTMVSRQLLDVLEKHHCKAVADVGQPFDPSIHEAIGQQPSDDHPEGTIVLAAKTGYQLHDRVVRASQVIVSTGAAKPDEGQN